MDYLLFQIFPYIALGVLIVGSIVRYERDPFTWKSSSSQLLRRKQLMLGSVLFHVGVLVVFFGHLVGLLTPIWVFDAVGISHGFKQVMAILVGGVAGAAAIVGGAILLHRRLTDSRILATSSVADTTILLILVVQLGLGLGTILVSVDHLDGHEMTKFMAWAQGIFTFDPNASAYMAEAHWIFRAHIFLGLVIFLLFPFTRLVHMLSAPFRYVTTRKGWQIVRTKNWAPAQTSAIPAANAALAALARQLTGKTAAPTAHVGGRKPETATGWAPGLIGLALSPLVLFLKAMDAVGTKLAGDAAKRDAKSTPAE
jgi:nitrate reductase gamma subunit